MENSGRPQGQLPANRAFVLQFRSHADLKGDSFDGRIEHIASGRAALFHSVEELITCLQDLLPPSSQIPNE